MALRYPAQQFQMMGMQAAMRPPAPAISTQVPQAAKRSEPSIADNLSGSLALTSDYKFRGVTQTSRNPAVQGNIDYNHESGAYLGLWASNVDFGDNKANTEFDVYAGYSTEVAPGLTADGGVIYYFYPGAGSLNYEYWELYIALEQELNLAEQDIAVGASLNYSPDNFGESGQAYYLAATASSEVAPDITIDGELGYQWIDDNAVFLLPDYLTWNLGVAYNIGDGYEAKLQYVDTDIDEASCATGCDSIAVVTVSKTF